MKNSRTQLIAQINKVENELSVYRIRITQSKKSALKDSYKIIRVALVLTPLTLIFLSKKSLNGIAHSLLALGKITFITYFKRQIMQLFTNQ
jgi:hypothetical protein